MIEDSTFDFYTQLIINHNEIRGQDAITQLVAIGAAESGLDNLAIGNNAKNGTDPESPAYYHVGLGWLQIDTYWAYRAHGPNWDWIAIREDPEASLDYIVNTPGFILHQGVNDTYLRFDLWNVWPKKSDQFKSQAVQSYHRVNTS